MLSCESRGRELGWGPPPAQLRDICLERLSTLEGTSGTWRLRMRPSSDEKAYAVKMRSLRSVCGMSRRDRCRNRDVRERYGLKEDVVT
ncbi:hypothetical protein EVAR_59873_1 [Eumeta japonica]|uniref:Uncharacterized protein n=1 Tax=Eumeta variegata TaxID=151549 RepID=A0A4C1XR78_EUMVA|nr:hypothetical protein EVAR_59873_1 [Eumeta japonica]